MTKLYYDCPIKTVYMMKYFDCKIECGQGMSWTRGDIYRRMFEAGKDMGDLFYIAEESESMFEPQEDDLNDEGMYFEGSIWNDPCSTHTHNPKHDSIIMRNDKHFFKPMTEL